MKPKSKTITKLLTILVVLAIISVYVWYTYDYIFSIDQSGHTKLTLWIIALAILILPWEVLSKILLQLFKTVTTRTIALSQWLNKSIKDLFKQAKSQNDQPGFRSVLVWILLAIFANIINYSFIRKMPIGYDAHIGFNFLILLVGIYIARKIIRGLHPGLFQALDDRLRVKVEQGFLRKPNIIKLTSYLILMAGGIMVMESWIYKPTERLAFWNVDLNDNYYNQVTSRIEINNLDLGNQTIEGNIRINEFGQVTDILIESIQFVTVNNQRIPLRVDYVKDLGLGTRTYKSGTIPFQADLFGNSYLFPFGDYNGEIIIVIKGYWPTYLQPDMDTSIYSRIDSVNLIKRETLHTTSTDDKSKEQINVFTYRFTLSYAPYLKVLFVAVFLILFVFLLAIWKTKKMDQVMGLSIGIFATLYAIKGWVIPDEILSQGSPLLFDRISLIYIVVFLASLLYKYSDQN